jgi:hypothetical protein
MAVQFLVGFEGFLFELMHCFVVGVLRFIVLARLVVQLSEQNYSMLEIKGRELDD